MEARIKPLAVERKAKGAVRVRKVDERDAGKAPYSQAPWPYRASRCETPRRQRGLQRKLALASMMEPDMELARESRVEKEAHPDGLKERQDKDGA